MIRHQWDLYVTDQIGHRLVVVDPYESAEIVSRMNDIATWQIVLPSDSDAARAFLADPFARIEFVLDRVIYRSGPVTHLERTVDVSGDVLTVSGVDDAVWLARRLAHPQPGTPAPPYNSTAEDVRTGNLAVVLAQLVDRNAGPAAVPARRVPGMSVPIPGPSGPSISVSARWQNLLTLLQDTARPHGLVFDVVGLQFRVRAPRALGAVFSEGLETLAGWTMTTEAAAANKAIVAGQGVGAARLIRETIDAGSVATWGLAETFVDRRDTAALDELDKAGLEAVTAGIKPVTVTFEPVETDTQSFGHQWLLGDIVTVQVGGLAITNQISEIHITLDANGDTIVPSVGAVHGDLALFRSLSGLERRMRQLERI
jgi:hypothetical protein